PGASHSVFNTNAGVATRTTRGKDGGLEGTWTYQWTSFGRGPSGLPHDDPKAMVDVVYPTGDCTRHYFNTIYWQSPANGRGWEYGLPFDYSQSEAGRYLSSEVWDANAGGACTGDKLRSTYLAFRHDVLPDDGNAPPSEWYHTHRQVVGTRVVFHDDGDSFVDTQNSDYDGLGHFRRTVTTGSLWSGSNTQERRDVFTAYDRAQGTYGSPGYQIPSPSDPWILGTFSHVETHEPDAFGQASKRVDMQYDAATGDLLCTRVRKSTAALKAHDIVTTYTRDARGRVTDLKTYGGDLQNLSTAGDGCAGLPSQPEYWVRHGYEHGVRTSTRPILPDGTPGPFLILDRDVDPTSGAALTERDPSGFAVTYQYDGQGRIDRVVPEEGAVTTIQYLPATASSLQKMITRQRDPISDSVLSTQEAWFDDFGRAWRHRSSMPGGAWNERETLYNARGWVTSVSEPADLSKRTEFRDFDPFGRATRIRPPSGPAHDTLVAYEGVRRVTTQVKVARPWGEAYVSRVREVDSHGRLRRTEEPSGPQDAMTPTTYAYDVASRLTRVRSGSGTVQERRYVYDNRGFLLSETHPEKGPAGNGTVTYGARDSQGRVLRVTDGPSDLNYGYDFLGRRTRVWDRNAGSRVVVAIEYDGAPGRGVGKIWKATRNQWVDVPWTAGATEELAKVVETFSYQGLAGAVSAKSTRTTVGGEAVTFNQTYDWNDLGLPSRVHYAGQGTDYTYDQGLLNGVTGWGTFEYHPSGMWHRVHHANGVQDRQDLHPDYTGRTGALWAIGSALGTVGIGNLEYDGAGNPSDIGVWSFAYDAVGRLVESDYLGWNQDFAWDRFGNQTSRTTIGPRSGPQVWNYNIDPATNRLQGPTYDAAGNLTAWGGNTYSWNESGLLEHTLAGGLDWIYLYTASGERVATLMPSSQPVIRWTDRDLGQRVLSEHVQVGSVGAPGATFSTKRYVWAGGRPLASDGPDGVRHYHPDQLGNLRLATDSSGVVAFGMGFLPFGEPADPIDSSEIHHFTGHERDHPTGLDYMHARFYSQNQGRFLSVDSWRGAPGSPQSLNRYAYALGSPIRFVDPDGREPVDAGWLGTSIARAFEFYGLASDPTTLQGIARLSDGGFKIGTSTFKGGRSVGKILDGKRLEAIKLLNPGKNAIEGSHDIALGLHEVFPEVFGDPRIRNPFDLSGLFRRRSPEPVEVEAGGVITGNFGETIDVIGAKPQLPLVPLESPGVTLPEPAPSQTTIAVGTSTVCNQQSCFRIGVVGESLEEISQEARRITEEILAIGGLNELLSGACQLNGGMVCALGAGGGGGGGIHPWQVVYLY
ncbi:MAG: RHS repeat-associated core domain-containing protein, partial [Acidobacteriota bacterium]